MKKIVNNWLFIKKLRCFDALVFLLKRYYGGENMELKKIQKDIWQNKINKGFNTTDVNKEFCLLYGEVSEAYDAWRKKKDDLNEELADIAIYLMGLSEMLGFDLADETIEKSFKE